jgi:DNA repair ATPase RecN
MNLHDIASSEEISNFVESIDELEQIKKTFEINIAVLQITGTNQAINEINERIEGMIKLAEKWKKDYPERFPDALRNIKQELEQQAKLIYLLLKPN